MFKTVELNGELHLLRRTRKGWTKVKQAQDDKNSKILSNTDLSSLFGLEIVGR